VPGARLVTDSGNFTIIAEHVWRATAPDAFVGSSNGRFMGAAIPQALGVALQDRSRPTVCSVGDGGLPPFFAELRLAVERRLPLLLVLMSDGYYGSMRQRVRDRGYTDAGVVVASRSWQEAMTAIGWDASVVTTVAAFESAVATWRVSAGPRFIQAVMPDGPYLEMVQPLRP
jgi:acetolactate synthase-1/2/3 large subunit